MGCFKLKTMLHGLVTQRSEHSMAARAQTLPSLKESHQFARTIGSDRATDAGSRARESSSHSRAFTRTQSIRGNQAVLRMLNHSPATPVLQRKCGCEGSGADCDSCAEKNEVTVQRNAGNLGAPKAIPPIVHDVLGSPGVPMGSTIRAFMEQRFGRDFASVRLHTDARAAESARAVNALAYTIGDHIAFGNGMYAPDSSSGQKLLAHELAHTIQQSGTGSRLKADSAISNPADAFEHEATQAAEHVVADQIVAVQPSGNSVIAREPDDKSPATPAAPASAVVSAAGPATCDNGPQMFCNTGNKGCPTFKKGMTGTWAHICYKCGPKGVYQKTKDEGTGVKCVGCGDKLKVTSSDKPDCSIEVTAIDHGPAKDTGNLIDLHPEAAQKLWSCVKGATKKVACGNFKLPVSVSHTENTCP